MYEKALIHAWKIYSLHELLNNRFISNPMGNTKIFAPDLVLVCSFYSVIICLKLFVDIIPLVINCT